MSRAVAGIDLGTRKTAAAVFDAAGKPQLVTNAQGEAITRSCAFYDKDGTAIVGTEAANRGVVESDRFVVDAKRSAGTGEPVATVDGKQIFAGDVMEVVLANAKRDIESTLGEEITDVVLTRPANWTNAAKSELEGAATSIGLNAILMPSEPVAGLIGMGVAGQGDGLVLAIDVGGGTTDVSIAEVDGNDIEICMTGGVPRLGGSDFNSVLLDLALQRFEKLHGRRPDVERDGSFLQELHQQIEYSKKVLSTRPSTRIVLPCNGKVLDLEIRRDEYEPLTRHLVNEVYDCVDQTLAEAGTTMESIRAVYLIGAQTQDPAFAAMLAERYGRNPWPKSDPIYCVAKGALLMAQMELERQGHRVRSGRRVLPPIDLSAREVTSHPLGTAALNERKQLIQSVIIPKGHPIPAKRVERYALSHPGQTAAFIRVLEGEDDQPAEECQPLGHFMLEGAEAVYDREHHIEIEYRLDKNGMLSATARDPLSGAQAEMTIDYETARQKPKPEPKPDPKPESTPEAKAS